MSEPNRLLGLHRVVLGLAQGVGATVASYCQLMTGVTDLTLWAIVGTLFFTVSSGTIFGRGRKD